MTKILVIESNEAQARSLCVNLRARHYDAVAAADGRTGLVAASRTRPDAVLLDLDLPDLHGLDVVAGLRGWSSVPIIAISDGSAPLDIIDGLDAGVDDYLTKPFDIGELFARLRAVLRRSRLVEEAPVVTTDAFTVDFAARCATRAGVEIHLTRTEWRLIEVLINNAGKVVARETLLREVWGADYETETQYLRVYLSQIRRKLEPIPHSPRYFVTHPGLGVRFENETPRPGWPLVGAGRDGTLARGRPRGTTPSAGAGPGPVGHTSGLDLPIPTPAARAHCRH